MGSTSREGIKVRFWSLAGDRSTYLQGRRKSVLFGPGKLWDNEGKKMTRVKEEMVDMF